MKGFLLRIRDIEDIKTIHLRHILQSVLIFSCFCTLDTIPVKNTVWLIMAVTAVIAIAIIMLLVGKIRIGKWSNALNIVAALFLVGCSFTEYLFPLAIFFITLSAGIRLIYAREIFNDYSTLLFIIISVFLGIVLRFVLVLLPVWTLSILMLLTIFNPIIEKENSKNAKNQEKINAETDELNSENIEKKENLNSLSKSFIILSVSILTLFFIYVEVFGGALTEEVSDAFPMQIVNFAYLFGYVVFILTVLSFRIKPTSILIMLLLVFGLFFFLIPFMSTVGIYVLLFAGGGIKVLMLAFPVTMFKGKYKQVGAISGVLVYRLAFLFSRITKTLAGAHWTTTSPLTYALATVGIALGAGLIFLLSYWNKQELKAEYEKRPPVIKEVIREVPVLVEVPIIKKPLPLDLSAQERRVAELLLKGKSKMKIADELNVSDGTVSKYMTRIYTKSGVDGQKEFIAHFTIGTTD